MRKLLVSIILVLALLVPSMALGADCTVNKGAYVLLGTPQGLKQVEALRDVPVDIFEKQPTREMLDQLGPEYSTGIAVKDGGGNFVIVAREDLNCSKK